MLCPHRLEKAMVRLMYNMPAVQKHSMGEYEAAIEQCLRRRVRWLWKKALLVVGIVSTSTSSFTTSCPTRYTTGALNPRSASSALVGLWCWCSSCESTCDDCRLFISNFGLETKGSACSSRVCVGGGAHANRLETETLQAMRKLVCTILDNNLSEEPIAAS